MDQSERCMGCMEESSGAAFCTRCGWRQDSGAESPLYLPPGTVLRGQYLVGRSLGYAAAGVTYLAWDSSFERKVELKEFFPQGLADRLPGAAVAPRSGQEDVYRQRLEEFLDGPAVSAALYSFRANGSAYLVTERVKELAFDPGIAESISHQETRAIERPTDREISREVDTDFIAARSVSDHPPAMDPTLTIPEPHTVTELPEVSTPFEAPPNPRPWLKWAAAFFALVLAGGVGYDLQQRREREAQQQREREAQEERERQREVEARKQRELQFQRELAAQRERELQQQRELAGQRERELLQKQSTLAAQQREMQRQKELQRQKEQQQQAELQRQAEQKRQLEQQRLAEQKRLLERPNSVTTPEIRRPNIETPQRNPVSYDQRLAQAQAALRQRSPQAAQLAEQTIQMDPSKPGGYEVLGYSRLYFLSDPSGAEIAMRAAIARGGSAVFRVRHDHGSGNFQKYCSGVLMIRRSGISYAAADRSDLVEAGTGEIKDVNRNKRLHDSFHIKTASRNYNFGPTSNQPDAEVALAVRLLGKP